MVRCSHYPQSPHFLDACDELGLLVWEEAPGWHNVSTGAAWQDLVVQNVRDMVSRDRSRPSVIIWGTRLNETPDDPALWAATRQAAAELDGSRPSSGAMAYHDDVMERGRLRLQRLQRQPEDRHGRAEAGVPRPAVPGYRSGRPRGGQAAAFRLDRPAGPARQAGGPARRGAEPGPLAAGSFRDAGVGRVRLRLDTRPGRTPSSGPGWRTASGYSSRGRPSTSPSPPRAHPVIIPVFFWEPGGAVPARPGRDGRQQLRAAGSLHRRLAGEHALPAGSPLYRGLITRRS